MPCYEGPRPEDTERARLMAGALNSLLCGVLKKDELAERFAAMWCRNHELVDAINAKQRYTAEAGRLQRFCDDVLIAYNVARGAVKPCEHAKAAPTFDQNWYCPDCGARSGA